MRPSTRMVVLDVRLQSSSGLWTPAALGLLLALWLDANDFSTITLNGSTVSEWRDKSGNGRHVAQGVAANQPTYNLTGFNSKPTVVFDGTNDNMFRNVQTLPDSGFVFLVLRYNDATTARQGVIWSDAASLGPRYYIQADAGTLKAYSSEYFSAGSYTAGQQEILNLVTSTSTQILRNGVLAGSIGNSTGANNGLWIGNGRNFGSHTAMELSEMIAVSSTLSTADRQRIEGYLAHKWGLIANLPIDHPFKNNPPLA